MESVFLEMMKYDHGLLANFFGMLFCAIYGILKVILIISAINAFMKYSSKD